MKNYFKYLVLSIVMLLGTNNIYAQQMTSYEIPNNSYVIGTHVYTANISLSTVDIMIASQTINGNGRADMVIYYKTPRGIWINGSTGVSITAPSIFNVDYINEKVIDTVKYGDVNNDGTINTQDLVLITKYVATGEKPEGFVLANADVNGDGKVNKMDEVLLRKYLTGDYADKNLPNEPLGKTYYVEYVIDNKSTLTTHAVDYELKDHVIYETRKPSDPKKDGYVFEGWYLDDEYKEKFEFGVTKVTDHIVLFAKFVKASYGDVNNDGTINTQDLVLITKYVATGEKPEGFVLANADVNGDGKVNKMDEVLLRKYLTGDYADKNLPNEPLGKTYYVEYVIDNKSTLTTHAVDYELKDHVIYETRKPSDPKKDGYVFEGWYLDDEYKEKFEFGVTKVTDHIVLFAKFVKASYGDVNNDRTINAKDLVLLSRYVATGEMENSFVLANADVTGDGKVNKMDERLLSKYIAGDYPEKDLTKEPLGRAYYIDYVVDTTTLEIYETDYELKDHVLSSTQKPKDPEKAGYVFEGWYMDIDFKEKFEYNETKITTNTVLFAKFIKIN